MELSWLSGLSNIIWPWLFWSFTISLLVTKLMKTSPRRNKNTFRDSDKRFLVRSESGCRGLEETWISTMRKVSRQCNCPSILTLLTEDGNWDAETLIRKLDSGMINKIKFFILRKLLSSSLTIHNWLWWWCAKSKYSLWHYTGCVVSCYSTIALLILKQ